VVRADDAATRESTCVGGAQQRAAMPAGVVESTQLSVVVAQQNDRLRTDPDHFPVARVRDLVASTRRDPAAIPEDIELARVVNRVVIPR
jgi:hypothetical protein